MIGTQSGRGDAAYLARFREKNILDMKSYEFWNGDQIVGHGNGGVRGAQGVQLVAHTLGHGG